MCSAIGGISSETVSQRAENGGLDPSWLDFAFLGPPYFQSRGPQILIVKGLGTLNGKSGRPRNAKPTTTDPTPYSWPSELEKKLLQALKSSNVPSFATTLSLSVKV